MWTLIVIAGAILAGFLLFNLGGRGGGWWSGIGGLFGGGRKKCGYCRTWVKASSSHCPKCGYEFIDF
jgi:hypothetical protein